VIRAGTLPVRISTAVVDQLRYRPKLHVAAGELTFDPLETVPRVAMPAGTLSHQAPIRLPRGELQRSK